MPITVLGLGGSLREGSTTERALRIALEGAQAEGASVALLTPGLASLPLFDGTYSLEGYAAADQQAILGLLDAVRQADGLIIASPTYHNIVSGAVKNMLDFLELLKEDQPPRLEGKVVGLVTVQEGTSGTGNNTLTTMLLAARAMRAWVAPTMLSIPASRTAFDAAGQPINAAYTQRLKDLGAEVAKASAMFATHWR
ncbi:MAG TPA: NAD(P)H-dependent oxidoreductase [Ktedonobacterales bacterium]|nr:NAD(P)H-dependent oxidoreductase [Ktedonobacterales bacterium]